MQSSENMHQNIRMKKAKGRKDAEKHKTEKHAKNRKHTQEHKNKKR